ncbi:hypothetical protein IGB42_02856 [Andreprevotia sp. IGB-42]|uniref:hypothetical protein n=1 Tax=Andreprevotia sp. IGB-42 TaxID=2497473 RepID=UPI001357DEFD|nr:hypothetical protein [Andreprevotia sp. IGB-42]KAF0812567.1 hypothetical protein IGB42_02856 [Andreprevotia sp. IGB-42]
MTAVKGFFDEIGFSEAICTGFEWKGNDLEVFFEKGVDISGSVHPLAEKFSFESPCKITFSDVAKSGLKISRLVALPNSFETSIVERTADPFPVGGIHDFHLEGFMDGNPEKRWFVWTLSAKEAYFDDLE